MKMPSKKGISQFFLYHVEKIVLGLAVVAMGAFLYMGMKTPAYTEKTPDKLSKLATDAGNHIVKAGWDEIKEHRTGDDKADERVDKLKPVEIAQFDVGRFSGIRAKTRGRRADPSLDLAIPKDFEIQVVQAPLVITQPNTALSDLPLAGAEMEDAEGSSNRGVGRGESEGRNKPTRKRKEEKPTYGSVVTDVHRDLMLGYKPVRKAGQSGQNNNLGTRVANIVAVNALIEHQDLYDEFKKTFENSMAYTPIRDRPRYVYVEIQHKRKNGKWRDIGTQVRYDESEVFGNTQANEVVHPYYHDNVLTGPIPLIAQFDYRKIATHSKARRRVFAEPETDEEDDDGAGGFDGFGDTADDESETKNGDAEKKEKGGIRLGSDFALYEASNQRIKPQAKQKLLRFFHVLGTGTKNRGKQEYRVRIWLKDPNNEDPDDISNQGKSTGKRKGPKRGLNAGSSGLDQKEGVGRSGDDEEEKEEPELSEPYMKVEFEMKEQDVRDRIESEKQLRSEDGDDPLPSTTVTQKNQNSGGDDNVVDIANGDLNYCRCTEWAEFSAVIPSTGANAEFYAGTVESGKKKAESGRLVQASDNFAEIVATVWDLGTRIPYFKKVFRGDVLNMRVEKDKPIHVVNPLTLSVHSLEKHRVSTNALVVDIMGGDNVTVKSKLEFDTPGEVLIMDSSGNFHVQNTLNDAVNYRLSLLKEDDDNLFGKEKAKKDDEEDEGEGQGQGANFG